MNAAGAVTSRYDYLPFGEELGAGTGAPGSPTGMRTAAQGYSAADNVRQRYAETRLDDATGLDHTLWRKLESKSGRWTTPDPYGKSLTPPNPQSFNRYSYAANDPVNFVDPSGLCWEVIELAYLGDGIYQILDRYHLTINGASGSVKITAHYELSQPSSAGHILEAYKDRDRPSEAECEAKRQPLGGPTSDRDRADRAPRRGRRP